MSDSHSDICREGIVKEYADGRVRVLITVQSACAACHAKGICSSFEMAEKEFEAIADEPLAPGDRVKVSVAGGVAWRAVFFAFVLPMVVFGAILFAFFFMGSHESVAAIAALGAVGGYFLFLRLAGRSLFRSIEFHASKIPTSE